jgi:(1->4)-alpha-D-glucan 1-alpha-D-glucosylmutase
VKTDPPNPPESTYRLQFHAGFTFRDAAAIVPYLAQLGVTHVYASPYFTSRRGSMHGYDLIDPCHLDPELGTDEDYRAFLTAMRQHGLAHILDIVPNHMGVATNDNRWWNDVLMHGRSSRYADYFDIAWDDPPRAEMRGKVLLPVLGEPCKDALAKHTLTIDRENDEFVIRYYDRRFPISPETRDLAASAFAARSESRGINLLDDLLQRQHYRLAFWRVAADEINYRRFFEINDLAALRMDREEVFEATHALALRLVREGAVAGLRVDHPDGLLDPKQYFERLQQRAGPVYVVAEDILAADERLPQSWPVAGTTGYDFLNKINGLFIDPAGESPLTSLYREWIGCEDKPFEEHAYESKRRMLNEAFAGELTTLARKFCKVAQSDRKWRNLTFDSIRDALTEFVACFPAYRSYITADGTVEEADRSVIHSAVAAAIERNPSVDRLVFDLLEQTILSNAALAGRFQQLTAPVTAKGVEDTAFYIYNRLVSLNEVGGDPGRFGVSSDELHAYLIDRQQHWPHALSPLSTHDTKRSEDVRARINVLSEMPAQWREHVTRWQEMNAKFRTSPAHDNVAPSVNDEYLLYQTLIGAWTSPGDPQLGDRIKAYMIKATREAKVHTSWTNPSQPYETAMERFIDGILSSTEFLAEFEPFQRRISGIGLVNSLAQTVIRLTAPGVPDTYQGTELWDYSLVDPDNRRPVDYAVRQSMLAKLERLPANLEDASTKLWAISRLLRCRREMRGLFSHGQYMPVTISGPRRENIFAFIRRYEQKVALIVVPRLVTRLTRDEALFIDDEAWRDTWLHIPDFVQPMRMSNLLTGEMAEIPSSVDASTILHRLPVAAMVNK